MGGTGGGLVYNIDELKTTVARGLAASPVTEVLVEESVLGWEELEFEVVRDAKGQLITVCTIENIDPMGVHTGDSFCAAPMQTISQEVIDRLQKKSYAIVDKVGVIGGTNVQWAHDPVSDRDIIIEINPRTSRSSALASKATGFPIALGLGHARERPDARRDPLRQIWHARQVLSGRRLRRRQVRALGLREVQGRFGPPGHADARRG